MGTVENLDLFVWAEVKRLADATDPSAKPDEHMDFFAVHDRLVGLLELKKDWPGRKSILATLAQRSAGHLEVRYG